MKKNTLKLLIPIIVVIVALVSMTTVLIAWFAGAKTFISNIEFNTGIINVETELYALPDFNKDGIIDYGVEPIDIKTSSSGIQIKNAVPGEVFSYRLVAKNQSKNPLWFALLMTAKKAETTPNLNDAFSFQTTLGVESPMSYRVPLIGTALNIIDEQKDDVSGKIPIIRISPGETFVMDFFLVFEHLSYLKSIPELSETFQNLTDLNAYKNLTFDACKFFFEFRQSAEI